MMCDREGTPVELVSQERLAELATGHHFFPIDQYEGELASGPMVEGEVGFLGKVEAMIDALNPGEYQVKVKVICRLVRAQ